MIGIIGAMEKEVATLLSRLEGRAAREICGITYHTGTLEGQEVVVARAGIGKVNAALCAQTMILSFSPTLILNTGVAGALAPDLNVGDCIVATCYVQHDMDTTAFGDPAGLLSVGGRELVELPADEAAAARLLAAAQQVGLRARYGKLASGDQFISRQEQKELISHLFAADGCEMEGAAIAHAACAAGVPVCSLRVLSDRADGEAQVDYPTFVTQAAEKSAEATLAFLRL